MTHRWTIFDNNLVARIIFEPRENLIHLFLTGNPYLLLNVPIDLIPNSYDEKRHAYLRPNFLPWTLVRRNLPESWLIDVVLIGRPLEITPMLPGEVSAGVLVLLLNARFFAMAISLLDEFIQRRANNT